MKLQLALDGTLTDSLALLEKIHTYIDVVEIGTPLIYREGIHAAAHIHAAFPHLPLLADLKIMDAGDEEASIAFTADCQYVTVLGVTQDETITGTVQAARRYGGQVVVDTLQMPLNRAPALLDLGCDILCIHTAHDLHTSASPETLHTLRSTLPNARLAVAGGITAENIHRVLPFLPEIIVVGSAITQAADPLYTVQLLKEQMS